ncbi:MAG TPA: type II toxin-antitoxin system VapC family toxin [Longimicrobiales bacterium]|nr:type II toxin-antitoxin system VapC family toxin [Candidatus Palauibacterales bacterium]HKJ02905.1 type II toxin-antitoxin system VapC family toxin [Longimicrobiales bacterium]
MIVDSSALLSVLFREERHEEIIGCLLDDPGPAIGAPTLAETGIVLEDRLPRAAGASVRWTNAKAVPATSAARPSAVTRVAAARKASTSDLLSSSVTISRRPS